METKTGKIYFGWWIVIVSFLIMAFVYAPSLSLIGLFVSPIATEFDVSLTAVGTTITLNIFGSAIGSLFAGKLLTKYSLKRVLAASLALFGLGYLGMGLATSMMLLYVASFIRGLAGAAVAIVPISMIINNWFGNKVKGKAMSLAMIGSGLGAIVLSPVTGFIISNFSWREGYFFFAIMVAVTIPLVLLTFTRTPEEMNIEKIGVDPEAAEVQQQTSGVSVKEALAGATFWIIFVSFLIISGNSQSWNNNGASFLGGIGFETGQIAGIISATALGTTSGKLLLGWVYDKWNARVSTISGVAFIIAGYALLIVAESLQFIAIVGAFVLGIGLATMSICLPLISSELFGNKSYGTLVGYFQIAASLGASFLPLGTAMVFDATNSFNASWIALIILALITIVLINLAYQGRKKNKDVNMSANETPN